MRKAVGFFLFAALALSLTASDIATRPSAITVEGKSYSDIKDVHMVTGGRIVLLYPGGGATIAADKLPASFRDAWGITGADIEASKKALERETSATFDQAVRAGLFRDVDGVVYDLRKPQPGWVQFTSAKVLQVVDDGALVDPSPNQPTTTVVYIRNLKMGILTENDLVTVMAKLTGHVSLEARFGYQRTIRCYDAGRSCARNDIPSAIAKEGKSWAVLSSVLHPKQVPASLPDRGKLRAVGSAFFVTEDGYLLTNFHVVDSAEKITVRCSGNFLPAEVVDVDRVNDVAILKVTGTNFHALSISRRPAVQLGEPVFTIGFPNIDVQGVEPKYTDGKISSLAGVQDDPAQYQISVPVQPGNSGGPLCDKNGAVIGIVVAKLSDVALLQSSGSVPQNVNYAVKAEQAIKLLRRVPNAALHEELAALDAPVRAVEDSVAMVLVY